MLECGGAGGVSDIGDIEDAEDGMPVDRIATRDVLPKRLVT